MIFEKEIRTWKKPITQTFASKRKNAKRFLYKSVLRYLP